MLGLYILDLLFLKPWTMSPYGVVQLTKKIRHKNYINNKMNSKCKKNKNYLKTV